MENQTPVTQVVETPQIVQEEPKVGTVQPRNNFLVILLSILLFLSVSIAGFFVFQTQKLVKELNMMKTEPISEDTVEPVVESDYSMNTYNGKNFSIDTSVWKLESDIDQSPATSEVLETVSFENRQARMNIQVGTDNLQKVLSSQDGEITGDMMVDGITATKKSGYGGIAGSVYSVSLVLENKGKTYLVSFYTQDTQNINDYEIDFNKAVSTFKFTN